MHISLNPTQSEVINWVSRSTEPLPAALIPVKDQPDMGDIQAMNAVRASLQQDDALMSYLDHVIAMRRDIAGTEPNMFAQTPESVMTPDESIESVAYISPIDYQVDGVTGSNTAVYANLIQLSPLDLYFTSLLAQDQLPLGVFYLSITPSLQASTARNWVLDYTIGDKIKGCIYYYFQDARIKITENTVTVADWQLSLRHKQCQKINGSLRGGIMTCDYNHKQSNRIRLKLGNWDCLLNRSKQSQLTGMFKLANTSTDKAYTLHQTKQDKQTMTNTHVIGEDRLLTHYYYTQHCPLPMWGRGIIENKAVAKTSTIAIPPLLWQSV